MGSVYIIYVCYFIAILHYHEDRFLEALDAVKEAWKHAELSNSLIDQANVSFLFSHILFGMNRDMEAWKYIEISLMNNSYIGNQHGIAVALEYMGYGYLWKGDYLNAYGAYEAAVEKYVGTVIEESGGTRCKENIARIKSKQRKPDLDVGFVRPSTDKDCQFDFYPAMQDISGWYIFLFSFVSSLIRNFTSDIWISYHLIMCTFYLINVFQLLLTCEAPFQAFPNSTICYTFSSICTYCYFYKVWCLHVIDQAQLCEVVCSNMRSSWLMNAFDSQNESILIYRHRDCSIKYVG